VVTHALAFLIRGGVRRRLLGQTQNNKTFLLLCKSSESLKFFAFFFGEKNGLQKFQGKFYVLAALNNCFPWGRFGNP
jgi:hypothetical protein